MTTQILSVISQSGILKRVVAVTDAGGTITPNGATTDVMTCTLDGNHTIAAPTGTPTDGQQLVMRLTQDATGGREPSWNAIYTFTGDTPLLSNTAGTTDVLGFQYNSATSKWECLASLIVETTQTGQIAGWRTRTTNSAFFDDTPKVRILSCRAPVVDGRTYFVTVSGEIEHDNGGGGAVEATIQNEFRITTDDTEPEITDPQIGRGLIYNANGIPVPTVIQVPYEATFTGFLRVAVVSFVPVGAVQARWTAASDRPMSLSVVDAGPTVVQDTLGIIY
jgi:hypothetical protein